MTTKPRTTRWAGHVATVRIEPTFEPHCWAMQILPVILTLRFIAQGWAPR